MPSIRIPLVKRISDELFETIQKQMTPAQRNALSSKDVVRISGMCDEFALNVTETVAAAAGVGPDQDEDPGAGGGD